MPYNAMDFAFMSVNFVYSIVFFVLKYFNTKATKLIPVKWRSKV